MPRRPSLSPSSSSESACEPKSASKTRTSRPLLANATAVFAAVTVFPSPVSADTNMITFVSASSFGLVTATTNRNASAAREAGSSLAGRTETFSAWKSGILAMRGTARMAAGSDAEKNRRRRSARRYAPNAATASESTSAIGSARASDKPTDSASSAGDVNTTPAPASSASTLSSSRRAVNSDSRVMVSVCSWIRAAIAGSWASMASVVAMASSLKSSAARSSASGGSSRSSSAASCSSVSSYC